MQDVLLKDTFAPLEWCIHRDNEQLARTATECLHILVMNNGVKFSDGSWELTVNFIRKFFDTTAPKALMDFRQDQVMDESGEKPAKLDEAGKEVLAKALRRPFAPEPANAPQTDEEVHEQKVMEAYGVLSDYATRVLDIDHRDWLLPAMTEGAS